MLVTALREKFRYNSAPELLDQCVDRFSLTFIAFTRILQDSHFFDEPIENDEDRKKTFNLANWKVENEQLVNFLMDLVIPIPAEYITQNQFKDSWQRLDGASIKFDKPKWRKTNI